MDTHAQTWQNTLILPCKLRLQSIPQSLGVHLVKITPKKGWDIALNCVIKIRNWLLCIDFSNNTYMLIEGSSTWKSNLNKKYKANMIHRRVTRFRHYRIVGKIRHWAFQSIRPWCTETDLFSLTWVHITKISPNVPNSERPNVEGWTVRWKKFCYMERITSFKM